MSDNDESVCLVLIGLPLRLRLRDCGVSEAMGPWALGEKNADLLCVCARFGVDAHGPVIRLDAVSKQHGRQALFVDASMSVFRGDRVGLVGPNGSGNRPCSE